MWRLLDMLFKIFSYKCEKQVFKFFRVKILKKLYNLKITQYFIVFQCKYFAFFIPARVSINQ